MSAHICPPKHAKIYQRLEERFGKVGAQSFYEGLKGDDIKIESLLSGKLSPKDALISTKFSTDTEFKNFILEDNVKDLTPEHRQYHIDKMISEKIKSFPIGSPNRYFYNTSNKKVDLKDVSDTEAEIAITKHIDEFIKNTNTTSSLLSWIRAGASIDQIDTYYTNGKAPSENTLNDVIRFLGVKDGNRVYTIKEFLQKNGITDSSFFSESVLIVEHNEPGKDLDISVFDITAEGISIHRDEGINLFNPFLENQKDIKKNAKNNDLRLGQNKTGFKHFSNGLLTAYIKHHNPSTKFRKIGILSANSQGKKSQLVDLNKTLPYLKYINKHLSEGFSEQINFRDSFPAELWGVFENIKLHEPKVYNQNPYDIVIDHLKAIDIDEMSKTQKIFYEQLQANQTFDRQTLLKAVRHYINTERAHKTAEQLNDDIVYQYASETLAMYQDLEKTNLNTLGQDFKNFIDKFRGMYNVDNDVFQSTWSVFALSIKKISRSLKEFNTKNQEHVAKIEKLFKLKHGYIGPIGFLKERVFGDLSSKMFEDMIQYEEVKYIDKDGNEKIMRVPMFLHWDKNDPKTQAVLASKQINDTHLEYSKFLLDSFQKQTIKLIAHNLSYNTNNYYGADGILDETALYIDAEASFKARYPNRGLIPILSKSASDVLIQNKDYKEFWQKTKDDLSNPNKLVDTDFEKNNRMNNNSENVILDIADRFGYQFSNNTPYGSDERLKLLGLRYDGSGLVVVDENAVKSVSTDLGLIYDMYFVNSERKVELESNAMPFLNAGMSLLEKIQADGGIQTEETQNFIKFFVERVAHGISNKNVGSINIGEYGADGAIMLTGVKRLTSNSAVAFSVPVALTSLTANMASMLAFANANSISSRLIGKTDHFTTTDLIFAANITSNVFSKMSSKEARMQLRKKIMIMDMYGLGNMDEKDITGLPLHQKHKKTIWQSHIMHWMNWKTDVWARGMVMVAQMHHEGSWDAYDIIEHSDGSYEITYNEKKDARLYKDGKLTEDGKLIKESRRQSLIDQGWQEESNENLVIGHDDKEQLGIKAIADQYMLGGYDRLTVPTADSNVLLSALTQFRKHLVTKVANKFTRSGYSESLGKRTIYTNTETGEKKVVWENRILEGQVTSLGIALRQVTEMNRTGLFNKKEWAKIPQERKENIVKLFIDIGMAASIYFFYAVLTGTDDEDPKDEPYLDENTLTKSFKYGFMDMLSIMDPKFYATMIKNPLPFAQNFEIINNVMFRGDPDKVLRLIPGTANIKVYDDLLGEEGVNE